MKDIVIVGHGGLAKEVAFLIEEINRAQPTWNLLGFIASRPDDTARPFGAYRVCGTDKWLAETRAALGVVFAIGRPALIQDLHTTLQRNRRLSFPNLVHPRVCGDWTRITMGDGNIVLNGASFTTDITIGSCNLFNPGCTIAHDCVLGSYNLINPGANVSGGVLLGDRVTVGTGAQILQYLRVGSEAIVGAGAVVVENITGPGTYIGVPARKMLEVKV